MAEFDIDSLDPLDPNDVASVQEVQLAAQANRTDQATRTLRIRRDAYIRFFGGTGQPGDKRMVMEDLRKFCRGGETPWDNDPRVHALLTGRFEVYRRIQDHLELEFDDLLERYVK